MRAVQEALDLSEEELPTRSMRSEGPPHPRTWADREPVADRRFKAAREGTLALAEKHGLPVENLISPDHVRRTMWSPPATRAEDDLRTALEDQLRQLGARPWQVGLVLDVLVAAVLDAERTPS